MTTTPKPCKATDCVNGKWKGKSRYNCFTCGGTGEFKQVASAEHQAMVDTIREYLPKRTFAVSLCNQMESKGSLSPKQMPFFNDLYAQAVKVSSRPAPVAVAVPPLQPDNTGWDAVVEMMNSANENGLKVARIRLNGVVFKGSQDRRTGKFNNIAVVSRHGNTLLATLDRTSGVLSPRNNRVDFSEKAWEDFKLNPVQTLAEIGKKEGNCCFCARDLTDHRSTAHGYGAICAKKFGLAWGKETADAIEANIADRVQEVVLELTDAGEYLVKDSESGEVIATFTSRRDALKFADQFSVVEEVQ